MGRLIPTLLGGTMVVLLSACAASGPAADEPVFEDAYTPTGSLIPRKNADRDGKRVILSKEEAQKAVDEVQRLGGTPR